ncbi:MAG: hypothetical protein M1814_002125 [Vezdaea aestivalis]|nr:MAG: hypothetical protein M1814_002125 [Vezdaea aestivalis]
MTRNSAAPPSKRRRSPQRPTSLRPSAPPPATNPGQAAGAEQLPLQKLPPVLGLSAPDSAGNADAPLPPYRQQDPLGLIGDEPPPPPYSLQPPSPLSAAEDLASDIERAQAAVARVQDRPLIPAGSPLHPAAMPNQFRVNLGNTLAQERARSGMQLLGLPTAILTRILSFLVVRTAVFPFRYGPLSATTTGNHSVSRPETAIARTCSRLANLTNGLLYFDNDFVFRHAQDLLLFFDTIGLRNCRNVRSVTAVLSIRPAWPSKLECQLTLTHWNALTRTPVIHPQIHPTQHATVDGAHSMAVLYILGSWMPALLSLLKTWPQRLPTEYQSSVLQMMHLLEMNFEPGKLLVNRFPRLSQLRIDIDDVFCHAGCHGPSSLMAIQQTLALLVSQRSLQRVSWSPRLSLAVALDQAQAARWWAAFVADVPAQLNLVDEIWTVAGSPAWDAGFWRYAYRLFGRADGREVGWELVGDKGKAYKKWLKKCGAQVGFAERCGRRADGQLLLTDSVEGGKAWEV